MKPADRTRALELTDRVRDRLVAAGVPLDQARGPASRAAFAVVRTPTKAAKERARLAAAIDAGLAPPEAPVAFQAFDEALSGAVRCRVCGRELTDPSSRSGGIGPECQRKQQP